MNILRGLLVLVVFQAFALFAWGGESGLSENQIKAAYLYKFAAYVEWPPSAFAEANTPITIGVIGADEIVAELGNLRTDHSLVNDRAVEVKPLKPGESFSGVQILFIGRQQRQQLKQLLDNIQSQPILTVTESENALDAGSVINFIPIDDRIRFEVSVLHAERGGLKISARLLGVAQKIETGRPQ